MFDRNVTVLQPRAADQHHHYEVHEHRAPTDESVKLLKEMEEKALQKIVSAVRLENCAIECLVVHQHDVMTTDNHFFMRYRLNGHTFDVRHTVVDRLGSGDRREQVARELLKALSDDIARNLLAPALTASRVLQGIR